MPILNPDDAREVEDCFKSLFATAPQDRAREIRKLFVEVLDFEAATGQVNLASASSNVTLPATAERIAQLDSVHVLYIDLNTVDTDRVRRAEVEAAAKSIRDVLGDDMLLVVINKSGTQLHIIHPDFSGARLVLRRMVVGRDVPRRTVVQQVSNIYETYLKSGNLRAVLSKAFDVEEVTDKFFKKYHEIFDDALKSITGFGGDDDDAKRLFVQTLFNRLMFVHFLSRKGWLSINDDKDYLRALWIDYRNTSAPSPTGIAPNFYRDRLRLLFFTGLNNPDSRDLSGGASPLIGSVPFLNGGLFTEGEHDAEDSPIVVPDSVIEGALAELFEKFNFTVMESTPFDIEVAVDPEMLGKVFEELVNERHDSGAYYTPRPVVAFMCREALKGYLEGKDTGVSAKAIAAFVDLRETNSIRVDDRDTGGISVDAARRIGAALDEITVVDPACGSGAFLLGMMQELVDLQTTLYNAGVDSRSLHALKLHIIERNLYGVDIDEFAVNIAMLRLWLSLAIDFDGDTPPALPNLDFKIVCGDSLLGPDPSPDNYGTLFRDRVVRVADQFAELKGAYMNESDRFKKAERQDEIEALERELTAALSESPAPEGAVDWRVQFAEVFARNGGFDVAIANPPYVNVFRIDKDRKGYRKQLMGILATAKGRFDLFVPFMERGVTLLTRGGVFAFITPNKYLGAEYAAPLRQYFSNNAQLKMLCDLSDVPVFSASVYPVITFAHRELAFDSPSHITVFKSNYVNQSVVHIMPLGVVPAKAVKNLGNNWSPLISPRTVSLLATLRGSQILDDLADIVPAAWVNEAYDLKEALVEEEANPDRGQPERFAPFIVSGNIRRHRHTWESHSIRYMKSKYRKPLLDLASPVVSEARRSQIKMPKIITSGMSQRLTCVWDASGIAGGVSTTYIFPKRGYSGTYIAGVLNSRFMGYVYQANFGSLALAGGYMRVGAPQLKALPMPSASDESQQKIAKLVVDIVKRFGSDSQADVSDLESEIDRLVYDLYGLTSDQIKAIEEQE